jgi:hypothetical protein
MGPYPEPRRDLPVGTVEMDRPAEVPGELAGRSTAAVTEGPDGPRPSSGASWRGLASFECEALFALIAELSLRAVRGDSAKGEGDVDGHDEGSA